MLVFALYFNESAYSQNQPFSSGSTGSDGALTITAPGVTYFNPKTLNLNPTISNIFNFTTITIAAGSTLKLTEEVFHGPVYFLASGDVNIAGIIDLSGDSGPNGFSSQSERNVTYAGSGGYGGGLGGGPGIPPLPGNGPGGGAAGKAGANGGLAQFTGNQYLIPLVGGSGGGGAYCSGGFGPTGSAGGGAILIASSTSITVTGTINASSGTNYYNGTCATENGEGSGGAIRLISNTINTSGILDVSFGGSTLTAPFAGLIRIESFQGSVAGNLRGPSIKSVPFILSLPATSPSAVTVTSINGIAINANPFSFPDALINAPGPVTVSIQAQYIPPGTVPKLIVFSEAGPDQTITGTPLLGTLQSSTSTATVTFPPNAGSRGFVKAIWTQ